MERQNQMLTIVTLLGLLVITSCAHNSDSLNVEDINDIVDQILIALKEEEAIVSGLEPVAFANITQRDFKTWSGSISGLSNLHRQGNCSLIFHNDNAITLSAHIGAKNITFSMNYQVRPLFSWIDGLMKGGVDMIAVEISLHADGKTFHLKTLKISHMDGFEIRHVSIFGLSSSILLQQLANSFATKYKGKIVAAIEEGLGSFLRETISCHWDGICQTVK